MLNWICSLSFSRHIHKRCFHLRSCSENRKLYGTFNHVESEIQFKALVAYSFQAALTRACCRVSVISPWNPTGCISCLAWSNQIGLSSLQWVAATENCSNLCSCLGSGLSRRSYCSAPFFPLTPVVSCTCITILLWPTNNLAYFKE